jgi:hypothetical protein
MVGILHVAAMEASPPRLPWRVDGLVSVEPPADSSISEPSDRGSSARPIHARVLGSLAVVVTGDMAEDGRRTTTHCMVPAAANSSA